MKKLLFLLALIFFGSLSAQELNGSWKLVAVNGEPVTNEDSVRIYQDGYFAAGTKEKRTNRFMHAEGGEYTLTDGYSEVYDFYTQDSAMVGQQRNYEIDVSKDEMLLHNAAGDEMTWKKISDNENDLSRNWVITGRKRNGKISRSTPGARRTIKILGGDRFQWVAFNSDTGEFFGTGGGTYSAKDGEYVENIEFFSRDDSRAGAILPFQYELKDGEWHHSGKSSRGEEMYEIWSPYEEAFEK
ncbi:MAG: hypothetical protein WBL27_01070 [Salinimicrobium sp.]